MPTALSLKKRNKKKKHTQGNTAKTITRVTAIITTNINKYTHTSSDALFQDIFVHMLLHGTFWYTIKLWSLF